MSEPTWYLTYWKKWGEVIYSNPDVTELEEENFDDLFTVVFVSNASDNEIKSKIMKVSEIESVDIYPFQMRANDPSENQGKIEEKKSVQVPETKKYRYWKQSCPISFP
ncbi:hypothetical protein RWE15_21195 [Virgibacillus halophilus]|uniref:Chemotaxis protein CheA P2 response regulator-binding domain-containing protein n=1 Tax=Tigheibacillus halophilus TaxID=361280 RepID=A0ABU5CBZ9_9BACI|nr:hypothetical protein [Virgibacillus halophilus]